MDPHALASHPFVCARHGLHQHRLGRPHDRVRRQVAGGGRGRQVHERAQYHRPGLILGVDGRGLLSIGDLEQAEIRPIGILAHELGIHGHEVGPGEPFAEIFEGLGIGNQWVDSH